MTYLTRYKRAILLLALTAALPVLAGLLFGGEQDGYSDLYICSMHPWEAHDGPGRCAFCRMNLSKVIGHQPGDGLPGEDHLFVSPDDPMTVYLDAGKDAPSGKDLVPITQSPYYQPRAGKEHKHPLSDSHVQQNSADPATGLWTCGMHPDVIQDEPGICPICQMELTPLKSTTGSGQGATIEIDPVTRQNIGVKTESVTLQKLSRTIRTNGIVEVAEDQQVRVNSKVNGWVEILHVSRTGDVVRRGQPLFDLYSPELVAAQEDYLLALQAQRTLMKNNIARESNEVTGLVDAARRRLQLWDISDDQIDRLATTGDVKRTLTISSPADGVVLHKNIIAGSAVKPGMDLYLIADLSTVWLQLQVYEQDLPWVKPGARVKASSPYDPSVVFEGSVDYIYPVVQPANQTVQMRIVLPNQESTLKPEMYLEAYIESASAQPILTIPKSAVIRSGKRDLTFIDQGDGIYMPREISLGRESDDAYEVVAGLVKGENVVISAQFLLDSEAKLQEAVQRRLEQRKQGDLSSTASPSNHQH